MAEYDAREGNVVARKDAKNSAFYLRLTYVTNNVQISHSFTRSKSLHVHY